jgi:hypothetical protein
MMQNTATAPDSPTIAGAKLIVRIMARRKRATSEAELSVIFEKEARGLGAEFKAALGHALIAGWVKYRDAGRVLSGGATKAGLEAAGR